MDPTSDFFDEHSDFYGTVKINTCDTYFVEFIQKHNNNGKTFLDIGGGSGVFASFLKKKFNELEVSLVEPSLKMLEKNNDNSIVKFQGSLPDQLNIPDNKKYNYILLKEVLHHITGRSLAETRALAVESLVHTRNIMADDGYLLIHELFYESFLYPPFSRTMIFYLLKFQEKVRIKILPGEFLLGLSVCIYTREDLQRILKEGGFVIIDSYKEDWAHNFKKKGLLLKDWGRILYILKKEPSEETTDSDEVEGI